MNSKWVRWAAALAVGGVFLYLVPLFHVVSLKKAQKEVAAQVFDPVKFVDDFWDGALKKKAQKAVDAKVLLAALQKDAADAAKRFGYQLGLSGRTSFLVSGKGTVLQADESSVSIALEKDGPAAVVIEIGPVFGNSIRDGSGALDVSTFANTQEFNAVSTELNARVEKQVLPKLSKAVIGKPIEFVGGLDVSESDGVPATLNVVPISVELP